MIYLKYSYIISKGEAELSILNIVDGCISEDTDILANGGKIFIRNFNPDRNLVDEYDLNSILSSLDIDYKQFMDVCILCGCDYTSKIYGIGPITAYKMIKEHYDIETVLTKLTNKKYKDFEKIRIYIKTRIPKLKTY